MGRKLTEEEVRKVDEYARKHADPARALVYAVDVAPELDDYGRTHYVTFYMEETVKPKDWHP